MRGLFAAFVLSLAVPAIDVPGLGVSLSSVFFSLVALELLVGRNRAAFPSVPGWSVLALALWAGCALALAGPVWLGTRARIEADEIALVIRLAFWMSVFVITARLTARRPWGEQAAQWAAIGVVALALTRLAEAVLFGYWGQGNPRLLSQNDYGLCFSAFTPFLVLFALDGRGPRRLIATGGLVLTLAAAAGNGSRSSWAGIVAGAGCYALVALASGRLRTRSLAGGALVAAALVAGFLVAPTAWVAPIEARWRSLGRLERDKPYQTRRLIRTKGLLLFERNPVLGVGPGRFTKEAVALELPPALRGRSEAYYNRVTPHNAYINMLAETGLAGSVPLACLLAALAALGLPASVARAREGDAWAAAAYASFAATSLHLWMLSGLTGTLPWFIFGLTAGVIERARPRAFVFRPGFAAFAGRPAVTRAAL